MGVPSFIYDWFAPNGFDRINRRARGSSSQEVDGQIDGMGVADQHEDVGENDLAPANEGVPTLDDDGMKCAANGLFNLHNETVYANPSPVHHAGPDNGLQASPEEDHVRDDAAGHTDRSTSGDGASLESNPGPRWRTEDDDDSGDVTSHPEEDEEYPRHEKMKQQVIAGKLPCGSSPQERSNAVAVRSLKDEITTLRERLETSSDNEKNVSERLKSTQNALQREQETHQQALKDSRTIVQALKVATARIDKSSRDNDTLRSEMDAQRKTHVDQLGKMEQVLQGRERQIKDLQRELNTSKDRFDTVESALAGARSREMTFMEERKCGRCGDQEARGCHS